jgi:hypothetical protein
MRCMHAAVLAGGRPSRQRPRVQHTVTGYRHREHGITGRQKVRRGRVDGRSPPDQGAVQKGKAHGEHEPRPDGARVFPSSRGRRARDQSRVRRPKTEGIACDSHRRSVALPPLRGAVAPLRRRDLARRREPCYRGPWCLPGPDFHRLAAVSLSLGYAAHLLSLWRPNCWTHEGHTNR